MHSHTEGAGKSPSHHQKNNQARRLQRNKKAGGKLNKKHFVTFETARKREERRKQTKRARYLYLYHCLPIWISRGKSHVWIYEPAISGFLTKETSITQQVDSTITSDLSCNLLVVGYNLGDAFVSLTEELFSERRSHSGHSDWLYIEKSCLWFLLSNPFVYCTHYSNFAIIHYPFGVIYHREAKYIQKKTYKKTFGVVSYI